MVKIAHWLLKFGLPVAAAVGVPASLAASCTVSTGISYDFGLATNPVNSLNYIKNKDTYRVAPLFVEGLLKNGSTNKVLQTQLNFPKLEFHIVNAGPDAAHPVNGATLSRSFLDLKEWGILPGSIINSSQGTAMAGLTSGPGITHYQQIAFQLNSDHKWANGDEVRPDDYVDTLKYILDINTGSQHVIPLLENGIKNSQLIYDLQNQYYKTFKTPYVDPWGYETVNGERWESQNENDADLVHQIQTAALGFGMFTLDEYKEQTTAQAQHHDDISWFSHFFTDSVHPDKFKELFVQFEHSIAPSYVDIVNWFQRYLQFTPVNRKFIESTGGIQKFGTDKDHILCNSVWTPDEVELGPAGYLTFNKDGYYYAASRTVSNRIKIFFQSNPVVIASMFDDGYIAHAYIPAIYQLRFWADPDYRVFMKKNSGFGTQALQLNLDPSTGANQYLADVNFRRVIAYAINRNDMTKVAGQESSFPVTTWTAFGQAKDSNGVAIETYFDSQSFHPVAGQAETMPIQSYPYVVHNAKSAQFEQVDRTDISFRPDIAAHYLDLFKAAHSDLSAVTINYLYDGTELGKNIGIYIQSQLAHITNNFVQVELRGVPPNVFEDYRVRGKFDLVFANFDQYGSSIDSYIKRFFRPDKIDGVNQTTGYRDNPSGAWTYEQFFADLAKTNEDENKRNQLMIQSDIWAKMKELATPQVSEIANGVVTPAYMERVEGFFNYMDNAVDPTSHMPLWSTDSRIMEVVSGFEKIIRDQLPVLPMMEVDTNWEIRRIGGVDSLFIFSIQLAYDVTKRPSPLLPGIEGLA